MAANNDKEILEPIVKENAPGLYSMNGKSKWCKVVDVYDGDTVNIVFVHLGEIRHHKFRLFGVDSPELKPLKTLTDREAHIKSAKDSREFLQGLILNKLVWIDFSAEEKYGRLMGIIYTDDERLTNINSLMISSGHAKAYDGGKK